MTIYVFRSDGVFCSPEPCHIYRWYWQRREGLHCKALNARTGGTTFPETYYRKLVADLAENLVNIREHVLICEECQAWMDAQFDGIGLVKLNKEEEEKVWKGMDR